MAKSKKTLEANLRKLWKASQKEFKHLTKETSKLLKKGEKQLRKVSAESQKKMEFINATLKREKLYYQLGRTLGSSSTANWKRSKKANALSKEIKKLSKEIRTLS